MLYIWVYFLAATPTSKFTSRLVYKFIINPHRVSISSLFATSLQILLAYLLYPRRVFEIQRGFTRLGSRFLWLLFLLVFPQNSREAEASQREI